MRVLIVVDCGPTSEGIVSYGAGLAATTKGKVALLTVVERHTKGQIRIDMADELYRLAKLLNNEIQVHSYTKLGDPFEEISQMAEEWQADCIVMGPQNWTLSEVFFQKSLTSRMMKASKIPIVVVPRNTSHLSAGRQFRESIEAF